GAGFTQTRPSDRTIVANGFELPDARTRARQGEPYVTIYRAIVAEDVGAALSCARLATTQADSFRG
ncbi:hypothetical protein ABTA88_18535, partial [Acinetobacter baumannii]